MVIHVNQKSYNNIQSSRILFNWMCNKPWENTHTKLEINLRDPMSFHSLTTDANAPLLFEMHVCFTECHFSSWASRVVRDYLIIFRFLIQCHHSQSFAWNMVSVILFFLLFILYKLSCQSSSLYTATPQKKLTNTASPQEKSTKHRHHNNYF